VKSPIVYRIMDVEYRICRSMFSSESNPENDPLGNVLDRDFSISYTLVYFIFCLSRAASSSMSVFLVSPLVVDATV
jgi:hypothetical protein